MMLNQRTLSPTQEQEVLRGYERGRSLTALAEQWKIGKSTVARTIHRRGGTLRKPGPPSPYKVNHHFFDEIDTEEKAYWLGFIAADGYVDETRHLVRLELAVKDRDHLVAFCHALQSDRPVYAYGQSVLTTITSSPMVDSLVRLGIRQRKSKSLAWPTALRTDIPSRHFLRGYFDGDGSVSVITPNPVSKHKGTVNTLVFSLVGSTTFIESAAKRIARWCEWSSTPAVRPTKSEGISTVAFGGNRKNETLARVLYEGATVYLPRKYKIVEAFYEAYLGVPLLP